MKLREEFPLAFPYFFVTQPTPDSEIFKTGFIKMFSLTMANHFSRYGMTLKIMFSALAVFVELSTASHADVPQKMVLQPDSRYHSSEYNGPYCGVYSVYAALDVLGKRVNIADLLEPRYVGSPNGSNFAELQRAIEDHGAHSLPIQRLTLASLKSAKSPIILHVKSPVGGRRYNHWLLFLGVENGQARVLEAPQSLQLVDFANLLARWDGTGLVVSDAPITLSETVWLSRLSFSGFFLFIGSLVAFVHFLRKRRAILSPFTNRSVFSYAFEGLLLIGGASALAISWHAFQVHGFFLNPTAVAEVKSSYLSTFLPKLSLQETANKFGSKAAVFIDARYRRDYLLGHIEGAINVPVNASTEEREKILAPISRSSTLIVYCQSKGCSFDDKIATKLAFSGFKDVFIFSGGWKEWSASKKDGKNVAPQ